MIDHFQQEEEKYRQLLQNNAMEKEEDNDLLSEFDLDRLKSILRKNWYWLLLLPALSLMSAYMALRYIKPLYVSTSSLKMENKQEARMQALSPFQVPSETNLVGELELIKSPLIYEEVIKALDLSVGYFADGRILEQELFNDSPFIVEHSIQNEAFFGRKLYVEHLQDNKFRLSYDWFGKETIIEHQFDKPIQNQDFFLIIKKKKDFQDIGSPLFFKLYNKATVMQYLHDNLEAVIQNPTAKIIGISFKDHNRYKAREVLRKVDSLYTLKTIETKNRENTQKMRYLEEEIQKTEAQLNEAEGALEGFIISNKTDDVESTIGDYLQKIQQLTEERLKIQAQVQMLTSVQSTINLSKGVENSALFIPEGLDGSISNLITQLNQAKQEKDALALTEYEGTLGYARAEQKVNSLKNIVNQIVERSKKYAREKLQKIEREIQQMESDFIGLPSKKTELGKIKKNYNLVEGYYSELMKQKIQLGLAGAGVVPDFEVISPADLPLIPVSPNKLGIYAGAGALGIVLSILLVLGKYILHNTISNQRELEKLAAIPILGTVPKYLRQKLQVSKLVVHQSPKSSISEAFRSIRTNLDFMFPSVREERLRYTKKVISVTSTISGEGKTFVAINLGGIVALSGLKVIIIDLDMRKPKIHQAFDSSNDTGISTVLIGRHRLEEVIQHSELKNLDYITAGPLPPNPSELILRKEFDMLVASLHDLYDVVIIDTPPVGLVTDGILIMQNADLKLFVLRANYSKKSFVKNIVRLQRNHNLKQMGLVLNSTEGKGNYGYGYGYGGYYEDVDERKWYQRLPFLQKQKA